MRSRALTNTHENIENKYKPFFLLSSGHTDDIMAIIEPRDEKKTTATHTNIMHDSLTCERPVRCWRPPALSHHTVVGRAQKCQSRHAHATAMYTLLTNNVQSPQRSDVLLFAGLYEPSGLGCGRAAERSPT